MAVGDFGRAIAQEIKQRTDVEQVTLTGPLTYSLPMGTPTTTTHTVVFTQDGVGGHTVTFAGSPLNVDPTAGASTVVEFTPDGAGRKIIYPGSAGGVDSAAVQAIVSPAVAVEHKRMWDVGLRMGRNGARLRPLFTIIDDDGHADVIDYLAPILQPRGIPAGVAIVGNTSPMFTNPTYRVAMLNLQDAHGWELCSHTMSHLYLNAATQAQHIAESEEFLRVAHSHGFDVRNIVYPGGGVLATNAEITPRYFMGGFSTGTAVNSRDTMNPYMVNRIALGSMMSAPYQTLTEFKALVDSTIANNRWLVLMTHINATDAAGRKLIADVCDYIIAQGGVFVTPRDGLREFGDVVQSGSKNGGSGWWSLRPEGIVESSRYVMVRKGGLNYKAESAAPEAADGGAPFTVEWAVNSGWALGQGYVTEYGYAAGWERQVFRGAGGAISTRYWTGSAWSGWSRLLAGPTSVYTLNVTSRTVPARSSIDVSYSDASAQSTATFLAAPTGSLEAGIVWSVWSHGNGAARLRLANVTDADIVLAARDWRIRSVF